MDNERRKMRLAGSARRLKRVHVDQAVIRRHRRDGTDEPAITVQTSAGPIKARRVRFLGEAVLVQRLRKPLSCGAKVWIETTGALEVTP